MVSIVGFGRPKFGASIAKKSEPAAKTTKKVKTCSECGQVVK
jgi:hypothetical protein